MDRHLRRAPGAAGLGAECAHPGSTSGAHAGETPVALLAPGKSKTEKACVWVDHTTDYVAQRAVRFDFTPGRGPSTELRPSPRVSHMRVRLGTSSVEAGSNL